MKWSISPLQGYDIILYTNHRLKFRKTSNERKAIYKI